MSKKEVVLSETQQKVWNKIKDLKVEYFGLKNQFLADVCTPMNVDSEVLYLKLKAPASLISIENALPEVLVKNWEGKKVAAYALEHLETNIVAVVDNPALKPGGRKLQPQY
jgi:hypothetical protein